MLACRVKSCDTPPMTMTTPSSVMVAVWLATGTGCVCGGGGGVGGGGGGGEEETVSPHVIQMYPNVPHALILWSKSLPKLCLQKKFRIRLP